MPLQEIQQIDSLLIQLIVSTSITVFKDGARPGCSYDYCNEGRDQG